ncbi:MAG: DNA recombination protein RmuC [Steroidobacteraceae bacterium]
MSSEVAIVALIALLLGAALGAVVTSFSSRRREQNLRVDLAVLQSQVKSQEDLQQDREATTEHATQRLRAAFDALANDSLRSNSEVFLTLAREHLGQHQQAATTALTEREKAIEALLQPLREALSRTEQQMQRIEKERAETYGSLKASLESVTLGQIGLQKETRSLVNALRRPEVRGQWGELTLRRLAELAGMVQHCDFSEQVHVRTADASLRPDMIVHMPDGRDLVVDVKTPLDAYLEAMDANTDELRETALRRHAQIMSERVRQLAAKSYWNQFERSPDFVILFVPGDQFLSAALAVNPAIIEDAIRQNVIIATPSSFVALLKTVAYGWRQTVLAQNAATIRELGEDLYKRLNVFVAHLSKLGRSLGTSVDAFNSAVGSLERQVLPGARKFTELGVHPERELEVLDPIEKLTREPQAANGKDDPESALFPEQRERIGE